MHSGHGSISNPITPVAFITLLFLLLMSGCGDRTIDPYEKNKGVYSIYGALQVGKRPNYIRVKDLQVPFDQEDPPELNATVQFENLASGTITTLEDTVVSFPTYTTHNFIVNEPIEPLGKYRITAERQDGATVQTLITAPHPTRIKFGPVFLVDCERQIEFLFFNVPAPEQILMEVGFFYQEKWNWSDVKIVARPERIHDTDSLFISMSPRNLLVEVFTPALDDSTGRPIPPRFLFPTVKCHELESNVVRVRIFHFGPEWKAVEPIYPINPDDIQDVENGLGFTGAYIRGELSFTVLQIPPGARATTH